MIKVFQFWQNVIKGFLGSFIPNPESKFKNSKLLNQYGGKNF